MVSLSPRLRDSLDYEDPEESDPRLTWGFRSLSIEGSEYHHYEEPEQDRRPSSASPEASTARRNRRQKKIEKQFQTLAPFEYKTVADGDSFRLVVLKPGDGRQPVDCQLVWENSRSPRLEYTSLSYCWESLERDMYIICDGYKLPVTKNLWQALQCLRSPTKKVLIWIDQICINQADMEERAQQVAIMKRIFQYSKQVIVWLGEEADNSSNLCEYAKKMRSRGGPRTSLSKILTSRQLDVALQKLLERPWFQRVWVIPEVCLAPDIRILIGSSSMTWEDLIRVVREARKPNTTGFNKQAALPGNARQRIAILSQMMQQQKGSKLHTDVSQLLILAKSSHATEMRDKVYAFYGMTIISTTPDYRVPIESLYIDIAHNYINNIEAAYDAWRGLDETQRTFQLMSILYSAGALHQKYHLPSWVPDWSFSWYLAPIWLKTSGAADITNNGMQEGVRCEHRAGGAERDHFEVLESGSGPRLRLSVLIADEITDLEDRDHDSDTNSVDEAEHETDEEETTDAVAYMRQRFRTRKGYGGVATQGIMVGDILAIFLGGDVPVILRRIERQSAEKEFCLLCEAFVGSNHIMSGEYLRAEWPSTEDIVLV